MRNRMLQRFFRDDGGNLSAVFALTLIPVVGLIGVGIDFTDSSKRKATLDAIADSASLAAVTPSMLSQSDSASVTAAMNLFNSQVSSISGIGPVTLTVTTQDTGLSRTVTVNYSTTSTALLGKLAGKTSVALTGTSAATGSVPPNIDFYLLLDNSPSMAIAATTAGTQPAKLRVARAVLRGDHRPGHLGCVDRPVQLGGSERAAPDAITRCGVRRRGHCGSLSPRHARACRGHPRLCAAAQ
jgi:Flp pilus assembly protein TadG